MTVASGVEPSDWSVYNSMKKNIYRFQQYAETQQYSTALNSIASLSFLRVSADSFIKRPVTIE
jgi:hypothetical protein